MRTRAQVESRPISKQSRGIEEIKKRSHQIAEQRLDNENVRGLWQSYFKKSKAKDYTPGLQHRLDLILDVIDSGVVQLPRALAHIARRLEKRRDLSLEPARYMALGKTVELPARGAQKLYRGSIVETIVDLCDDETRAVIEMGSGWGEHLSHIWLEGGPPDATYYACEITEPGRKCAKVLSALQEGFQLQAPYFNYVEPDFSFLQTLKGHVVAYTVHSVEQVEELPFELIVKLCESGHKVHVAHFEPIGWQMLEEREKNKTVRKHEKRCRRNHYNINLWPLLKRAESEGLIEIVQAIPYFFGPEYNSACMIVWRARSQ